MRTAIVIISITAALASGAAAPAGAASSLRVGSLTLRPCAGARGEWCGAIRRPLDPAKAKPPAPVIGVHLRWIPARHPGRGLPPLVAVEGGPGFPSIGSLVEYRAIFGPLLAERDLLLVDNRGTGASGLIDCPELQRFAGRASGSAFARRVARCAARITRRYGQAAHATDLFATAYATGDLAAVLRALRLPSVDLYGDSYGTWFVQAFMARYSELLHSVVLDSAYPIRDLDPWYTSSGAAMHAALDAVCERDAGCAASGKGTATSRVTTLVGRLRRAPITGTTRDADGSALRVRVDVRRVVDLVQDAGSDPVILRELDASVRAALTGDDTPLLRLAGQAGTYDHSPSTADYFSYGLYSAVACTDYPQLFDPASTPKQRRAELAARIPLAPAGAFAPFATREWLQVSGFTQPYDLCLDWPAPVHTVPVLPASAAPLPTSIPILVIGGDLDSLTPVADAATFAPALGAKVRVVTLRNAVHVTTEGDTFLTDAAACGQRIIRAFVRAPAKVAGLDAHCARHTAAVHTPGEFPVRFAGVRAARLVAGDDPGLRARRAATLAAAALADATIRRFYSGVNHGPGLRGGSFTTSGDGVLHLRLRAVRHVIDAAVSGTGTWDPATGAVSGRLTVTQGTQPPVTVAMHWTQRSRMAAATIGAARLTLPAP